MALLNGLNRLWIIGRRSERHYVRFYPNPGFLPCTDGFLESGGLEALAAQELVAVLQNISITPVFGDAYIMAGRSSFHLGGSREIGLRTASYLPVSSYVEVELDSAPIAGLTVRARIERKTLNAGTSVTGRIWNVTDGTVPTGGQGAASSSTSWVPETLTFSPASGAKKYRVEIIGGNANADILAIGYIEVVP